MYIQDVLLGVHSGYVARCIHLGCVARSIHLGCVAMLECVESECLASNPPSKQIM